MIRGKTATTSTVLNYWEDIAAWLRCENIVRNEFFQDAVITLKIGEKEESGRVQLDSIHPERDLVLCAVTGEILGGEQHGYLVLDFAQIQDERFRLVAQEEDLDEICVKTEILRQPQSAPPEE